MSNYESLVNEIQSEAKRVGEDNKNLRRILSEEDAIRNSKPPEVSAETFRNEYFAVADKIFYNLRNQNLNLAKVVPLNHRSSSLNKSFSRSDCRRKKCSRVYGSEPQRYSRRKFPFTPFHRSRFKIQFTIKIMQASNIFPAARS